MKLFTTTTTTTTDDGRRTTDDGRRLDGYTISSPCEPNGSGELKIMWTKTFHHFCVLLCHMGFHRNTVICLKIATSLKKSRDCSICFCVLLGCMGFHWNTGLPENCFFIKSKPDTFQKCPFITPLFSILGSGNTRYLAIRSNSSVCVKMKCDGAFIQSIN